MRKICLLLLLLILVPLASADSNSTGPFDIIRSAFAYSFDDMLKYQAENIYSLTGHNSSAAPSMLPDSLTKPRMDILKSDFLKQYADMEAFVFEWGMLIYLLGGGCIVLLASIKPSMSRQLHSISFVDKNILDLENFVKYLIIGLLIWIFADRGIELLFALEWVLKSFITAHMVVIPPPIPTIGIAYLIDSLAQFLLAGYGIYSFLVIGIVPL